MVDEYPLLKTTDKYPSKHDWFLLSGARKFEEAELRNFFSLLWTIICEKPAAQDFQSWVIELRIYDPLHSEQLYQISQLFPKESYRVLQKKFIVLKLKTRMFIQQLWIKEFIIRRSNMRLNLRFKGWFTILTICIG